MATGFTNAAEMLGAVGDVPLERIRMSPPPGLATVDDAIALASRGELHSELVDGVLIEKAKGFIESRIAIILATILEGYLEDHDLGIVVGADGFTEVTDGCVRAPDVSFFRWDNLPRRRVPTDPVPQLAPDLAVEVLSKTNTAKEMDRKLADYREGGVSVVWIIDPRGETAKLHLGDAAPVEIGPDGKLDAGELLPGFDLTLGKLLRRAGSGSAG